MGINIALDGPSGAGKSTISKIIAKKLGYIYVDTGAMYRSIALFAMDKGVSTTSAQQIIPLLKDIEIELKYVDDVQHIFLNNEDVSEKIRQNEVSMHASNVSAIKEVREFLFNLQRDMAKKNNIIMDGRDIGTVVLPDADVKIYLTASADDRAKRRYNELLEKGQAVSYDDLLNQINERDFNDTNREIAPLKQADDAVLVDTTGFELQKSVEVIYSIICDKINNTNKVNDKKKSLSPLRILFYQIIRGLVILVYSIAFNLKVVGKENIPKKGGNIVASNHRTYQDPILLSFPVKIPFSYMAKEELFKNKAFSALIKAFGAFPVRRGSGDMAVIDESVKRLNKGYNLIIFPEGTRSMDGTVGKGKTGVALIAAMAQVPVIPVGISFRGKLKFRSKIVINFGKPILPQELEIKSQSPKELKVLKLKIMQSITDLVDLNV